MGCFTTHASGTLDPPEVRNWRIHLIALIVSMSALASTQPFENHLLIDTDHGNSGI